MTIGTGVFKGVVRGKAIELEGEPGLREGQEVVVTIRLPGAGEKLPPGEGMRRAFGAWADDAEELDKFLEWNRQGRKQGRRELGP